MKYISVLKLAASIVIAELAGVIGSTFTVSSIPTWYAALAKPSLNPPSWVFGPVWTALYALMGIAAFIVWNKGWSRVDVRRALGVFALQLVLNAWWSIVFFGLHSPGWAWAVIILLWLAIIWTMILFSRISRAALWLLVPYIAWVSFAAYLNYALWMLN